MLIHNRTGKIIIGVDAGNFNIKTANFCFPFGVYKSDEHRDIFTELLYEQTYYTLAENPLPIANDRTKDNNFKTLTFIGVMKELLQSGINLTKPMEISLAVGLPINRYNVEKLKKNLQNYYKGTHLLEYDGHVAELVIKDVFVFPQGFPALYSKNPTSRMIEMAEYSGTGIPYDYILRNEPDTLIVDIGGGTVDVTTLKDGIPSGENFFSLDLGLHSCYIKMNDEAALLEDYGGGLGHSFITSYLLGMKTNLIDEEKEIIRSNIQTYASNLIAELKNRVRKLNKYYVLLVGGGADVVYNSLKPIGAIRNLDMLSSVNANAQGYEEMAQRYYTANASNA